MIEFDKQLWENAIYKSKMLLHQTGYFIVPFQEHPDSMANGYCYVHRLLAELKLGRFLRSGEVVHHKDQNKGNIDIDNILVFATNSDHVSFHLQNCDENLLIFCEDGTAKCKRSKTSHNSKCATCAKCGVPITGRSFLCVRCYRESRRIVKRPSREDFKTLLRNNTCEHLGEMFGVSGKAISKWCRLYGLPSNSYRIRKYSDKEWELL